MRFLLSFVLTSTAAVSVALFSACGGSIAPQGSPTSGSGGGAEGSSSGASSGGGGHDAGASVESDASLRKPEAGLPDVSVPEGATPPWDGSGPIPPTSPVIYQLAQKTSIAAPLPNPVGVTYDGQYLWILCSAGNPQPYTLVQYDQTTFKTLKTFTLASMLQGPSTYAGGIAWDGASIWISIAGDSQALVEVDPGSGKITKNISSPIGFPSGPSDMDFDGTNLWVSSGVGDGFRLDPASGGVVLHIVIGDRGMARDDGLAYRPGELFVGRMFGGLEVYDPASGKDLGAVVHQDGTNFVQGDMGPMVFVGAELVVLGQYGITSYDVVKAP